MMTGLIISTSWCCWYWWFFGIDF